MSEIIQFKIGLIYFVSVFFFPLSILLIKNQNNQYIEYWEYCCSSCFSYSTYVTIPPSFCWGAVGHQKCSASLVLLQWFFGTSSVLLLLKIFFNLHLNKIVRSVLHVEVSVKSVWKLDKRKFLQHLGFKIFRKVLKIRWN